MRKYMSIFDPSHEKWKLYFIRDVRKKKLPNNFEK